MLNLDDENNTEEGEVFDEETQTYVRRRKKVILTGVFVENEADIALDKLSSMKSGRF